jgi:hypothetical protein
VNLDGLDRGPVRAADGLVVVVAVLGGHRQLELVGDLEDLLLDQVHVGGQAVDRVRPGQGVLMGHDEGQHADHPAPVVVGHPEHARGDRAGTDLAQVLVAAPGHGRAPFRVGLGDLLDQREVAVQDGHLAVLGRVQGPGADDLAAGERDHHVGGLAGGGVDQVGPEPPVGLGSGQHVGLGGILEAVVGEPDRRGEEPGLRHDLPPGQVLLRAGRVEGVHRGRHYSSATIEPTRSPTPGSRLTRTMA